MGQGSSGSAGPGQTSAKDSSRGCYVRDGAFLSRYAPRGEAISATKYEQVLRRHLVCMSKRLIVVSIPWCGWEALPMRSVHVHCYEEDQGARQQREQAPWESGQTRARWLRHLYTGKE